ncbi:M48 family metalloprotease [bacterium]|nr:M48 family metalloprotease [candidate division CSSED10-310 bacterium]
MMRTLGCCLIILLVSCMAVRAGALDALKKVDINKVKGSVESGAKVGKAMRSGFADLTESEEYYIGRAVAATILSRYELSSDKSMTAYINRVGGVLAGVSDRPETFGGYHFCVIDSDEINAFAAPGGFIFVTRGLLARAPNEEAVAAVLAHEIAHVCLKHGLKAIKQSRLTGAFAVLAAEGAKQYGPGEVAQLTEAFGGAISDIAQNMIEKGYSRSQEFEADNLAVIYLGRAGYSSGGLLALLNGLRQSEGGEHTSAGFGKTHPSAGDRADKVHTQIENSGGPGEPNPVRTARWTPYLRHLAP